MGGLNNWNTRLLNLIIYLFFYILPTSISAQEGFISIQCCSKETYKDPRTNITWGTDARWWPSNSTCEDITRAVIHDTHYTKSRVFSSEIGHKWCYNLTTKRDESYLIRGTFLFGDLQRTSAPGAVFSVSVDATVIDLVTSETTAEGIFRATKNYVNFCMLKDLGDPYISKLELRPVTSDYLRLEPYAVLNLRDRVDTGNQGRIIRFPLDQYDRIWRPEHYADSVATQMSSSLSHISSRDPNIAFPPVEVLQTAISHPERLEFLYDDLEARDLRYDLYLYFLELDDFVKAGQRVFGVYVNGVNRLEVDISQSDVRSLKVVLNVTANRYLNLTMVKASNKSELGPMINAYELFEVHQKLVHDTLEQEVNIMLAVKNELQERNSGNAVLKSWSGDPCVPASWPGLFCQSVNGTSVITRIDLSFSKLSGSLPPSITKLTHLRELNLSNNYFTNTIPPFPASSSLTSMDIRHNNLKGDIAELLVSLPNLTTLYFGCNHLHNRSLPKANNRSNLVTDKGECSGKGPAHSKKGKMIGAVAGGCLLVALAVCLSLTSIYRRKLRSRMKLNENGYPMTKNAVYSIPADPAAKSISIEAYTLQFIESATEKYKTLIGEGGFGPVYRGTLPDGQEVAVKVRSSTSTQGTREFDNEVNLLSDIRHENLVPLLGYCCENDQQILVYPFMSNGSLQDRLYGEAAKRKTLDWPTRLSIALGAARGLTYLHSYSRRGVIHRDVKSSNILLDQSMSAKVADFGFSKYSPQEGDSGTSLEVRGTAGYLDPEYYSTQQLSAKSDVFSFGVVLLEIVSGREPLNIHRQRSEWSLVEWAKPHIRNSRIEEIVDPSIKGGYHAEAMWRVVEVALACIEPYSAYRPCMTDIVRELEDALIIENNASEYMRSIDSFGGSNRYSIERPIIILPNPNPTEVSPILSQPPPPQPR